MTGAVVQCMGYLTKDWNARKVKTKESKEVVFLENTIAVENGKTTDYFKLQTTDAKLTSEFGRGSQIAVTGSLMVTTWEDKDYQLSKTYKPLSEDRRKKDNPTKTEVKIVIQKLKTAPRPEELLAFATGSHG